LFFVLDVNIPEQVAHKKNGTVLPLAKDLSNRVIRLCFGSKRITPTKITSQILELDMLAGFLSVNQNAKSAKMARPLY